MNISYDAQIDALHIKLFPTEDKVQASQVDDDIYLNFDEKNRLVGIEILDASKRIDMRYLLPVNMRRDSEAGGRRSPQRDGWHKIRRELMRLKPESTEGHRWTA
jgi:uncharacterized protein YuzE